jgi:hypothetical protein
MLHAFKRTAASWELRRAKKFLYGNSNEQLAERQFYASIIPQGRGSILDVGANAGAKTEIFRHFAERVVAIEPDQARKGGPGWRVTSPGIASPMICSTSIAGFPREERRQAQCAYNEYSI